MNTPLFSFLTVNYKQPAVTLALLNSLLKLSYKNWELIVVNNHEDKDDILRQEIEKQPNCIYLESGANLGFAGGNNVGIPHCKGDYVFFINNDTEVEPDLLSAILPTLQTAGDALGMLSPKIKFYQDKQLIQYAGATPLSSFTMRNEGIGSMAKDDGSFDDVRETAFIHGAAMILPKKILANVGLMYADYFLYYEEYDWCARIAKAGYKIMYCGKGTVYHKESVSTGVDSPLKVYYLTRNRLLFARRNFEGMQRFLVWLYFSLVAMPKNVLSWSLKGRLDLAKAFWRGYVWNFTNK